MRSTVTIFSLILAGITFLVFSGTIEHQFVNYDDDIYVYDNPMIGTLSLENTEWLLTNFYYYAYIPVTMISHAIDYAIWRADARGHHLTNVLLHALNSAWIFVLGLTFVRMVRRTSDSVGHLQKERSGEVTVSMMVCVALSALLFSVHPLRAESVAWVSDRKDLLCAFFFLPGVLVYSKFISSKGTPAGYRWYSLAFVLFVLAVLSKSIAVVFPVILLLLDCLLFFPRDWYRKVWSLAADKIPFLIVSAIITVVSFSQSPDGKTAYAVAQLDGVGRILFPFHAASFYIFKTMAPFELSPIYPAVDVEQMSIGLAAVVLITAAALWLMLRGRPGLFLAWLGYLALFLPTVVGLSSGMQAVADRYSYLPTMALFLLLGVSIAQMLEGWKSAMRFACFAGLGVVIIAAATLAIQQAGYWETPESLWGYVVGHFPPKRDYVDAYINLGTALGSRQRYDEARGTLEKACELDSLSGDAFYNLGYILYVQGEWEKALRSFKRATEVDPKHAKAFFNLAILHSQMGRDDLATEAMQSSARLEYTPAQDELRSRGFSW